MDTGYEVVDINNYEEVWATKTLWQIVFTFEKNQFFFGAAVILLS
jgi:hypothetical protein